LVLPIIAHTLSLTKLEIRAKQFLPGSEVVWEEREGLRGREMWVEGEVGDGGKGREMTQILYAHMNKKIKNSDGARHG
jgi:hypothetical protein